MQSLELYHHSLESARIDRPIQVVSFCLRRLLLDLCDAGSDPSLEKDPSSLKDEWEEEEGLPSLASIY